MSKVNSTLQQLKNNDMIDEQYKRMYANSPTNDLFYSTIKTDKEKFLVDQSFLLLILQLIILLNICQIS